MTENELHYVKMGEVLLLNTEEGPVQVTFVGIHTPPVEVYVVDRGGEKKVLAEKLSYPEKRIFAGAGRLTEQGEAVSASIQSTLHRLISSYTCQGYDPGSIAALIAIHNQPE